MRFKTLMQAANGYDAGLEDQAHQILADAAVDLDWDLLQELDASARQPEKAIE